MRSSLWCALMAAAFAGPTVAKLPPLNDEAKAKAAEAAAKAAWGDKVSLYKHCLVLDRIAGNYKKTAANAAAPATTTPPCEDPGPFVAPTAVAAKPLEASGAHSPTGTAATPPSSNTPAAQVSGDAKTTQITPTKDKPIEMSEAHSPPGTAVSPPSTNATAAQAQGRSASAAPQSGTPKK